MKNLLDDKLDGFECEERADSKL